MEPLLWIPIVIGILLGANIIVYLVQRYLYHKAVPTTIGGILSYIFNWGALLFWPFMEITRPFWVRRKWLEKAGVQEGQVYLEEGFGFGTSPILAARMVGKTGKVYSVENALVAVATLWARAKIRMLKNLSLILSDASDTGLPDESVDIVFINDAFHEFGDKEGTLKELYRVLKPDRLLSIKEDTQRKAMKVVELIGADDLFSLIERDKTFCKFKKNA